MRKWLMGIGLVLLLAGCNAGKKGVTVAPYEFTEMEAKLVEQIQVDTINYFIVDGKTEGLDLEYVVEVYEKGELVAELFQAKGLVVEEFKKQLITFGLNKGEVFLSTSDGAGMTSSYPAEDEEAMWSSSHYLLNEEITLKKDEPAYLAAWAGNAANSISSIQSEKGEFPKDINQYDRVYIFKLTLLDHDPDKD